MTPNGIDFAFLLFCSVGSSVASIAWMAWLPGLAAVGTMAQPANLVAFSVWLSLFLALLMIFALPSCGN